MYDTEAYMKILKNTLSSRRFYHSLCVSQSAKKLAERYNQDVEKAEIAGLLHDITKETAKPLNLKLLNMQVLNFIRLIKGAISFCTKRPARQWLKFLG